MKRKKKSRNFIVRTKSHQKRIKQKYIYATSIFIFIIMLIPTIIVMIPKQENRAKEMIIEEHPIEEKKQEIEIEVVRQETNEIEKIPLETYVTSVVAAEMPAEFELEALKAQAIVARTYVVNYITREEEKISDTTKHQVYRNKKELKQLWGNKFDTYWNKVNEAVEATEGMILTYNEQPITPTYFSMSNGYTEDAKYYWGNELPYLKSVESKWEESLPNFIDQQIVRMKEINDALQMQLTPNSTIEITRTPSNRVHEITFDNRVFSGREVREKLKLRSSDFTIKQKDDYFIFTTKGYGHGVGMSQYGANEMAKEGKQYTDILNHYYQEVEFSSMSETTPHVVRK